MANAVRFSFIGLDKFTAPARRMAKSANKLRQRIKGAGDAAKTASEKFTKMGNKMKGASVAATGAIVASAKAFGDLESGVTNVLTLLDKDDVPKFKGEITGLAKEAVKMGFSIEDSTKALFDQVSALGANAKTTETFRQAQRLAIGGNADLAVSVEGISRLMNIYKDENLSAEEAANILFSSQKKGVTTVQALASNIGKVAPTAKLAGVGAIELGAVLAELTKSLSTEEAVTALNSALSGLTNPGTKAAKVLKKAGVPMKTSEIRAKGLGFTLQKLAEAADKNPDALGAMIPNIRALKAIAGLTEAKLRSIDETIVQTTDDIKNGTGLGEGYTMMMKTFNRQMGITFGTIKIFAASIGNSLVPVLKGLAFIVKGLIAAWAFLPTTIQQIAGPILAVVAAAAPVLLLFGKLAAVSTALGAALLAPWVLAVAGVGLLVVAISDLFANWEKRKEQLLGFASKVGGFFGFGDDEALDAAGPASNEFLSHSRLDVDMNITTPKGVTQQTKVKTSGNTSGNIGVNNKEAA